MSLFLLSGGLILILLLIFYKLVFSTSDEIPQSKPLDSKQFSQLKKHTRPATQDIPSAQQQRPLHPPAHHLDTPNQNTQDQQHPKKPEGSSFLAEFLGEFFLYAIFKGFIFLIKKFFLLLGRIFD